MLLAAELLMNILVIFTQRLDSHIFVLANCGTMMQDF